MPTMDIRIDDSCFDLRAHQIARFDDAPGVAVLCLRGELWLTQDGDLNDVILGPGEHFTFDRRGLALVEALKASSLRIAMPVERRAEAPVLAHARPNGALRMAGRADAGVRDQVVVKRRSRDGHGSAHYERHLAGI